MALTVRESKLFSIDLYGTNVDVCLELINVLFDSGMEKLSPEKYPNEIDVTIAGSFANTENSNRLRELKKNGNHLCTYIKDTTNPSI